MKLSDKGYSDPKLWKKISPSAGGLKDLFRAFWKKALKSLSRFFFIFGIIQNQLRAANSAGWLICKNACFSVAIGQRSILVHFGPDFSRNGHKLKAVCRNHMKFFIFNVEHWNTGNTRDDYK